MKELQEYIQQLVQPNICVKVILIDNLLIKITLTNDNFSVSKLFLIPFMSIFYFQQFDSYIDRMLFKLAKYE